MKQAGLGILLLLIVSCAPKNEVSSISFARSGAWQDERAAINIDSSLRYHYYGDRSFSSYYYEGKVSAGFWDTLNRKVSAINFNKVRPDSQTNVADVEYWELIIHFKNKKMRFVRMGLVVTDSLSRLASWIDNSYKRIKLTNVAKPYKFETHFQDYPRPDIDQIRFPPPIKRPKNYK